MRSNAASLSEALYRNMEEEIEKLTEHVQPALVFRSSVVTQEGSRSAQPNVRCGWLT